MMMRMGERELKRWTRRPFCSSRFYTLKHQNTTSYPAILATPLQSTYTSEDQRSHFNYTKFMVRCEILTHRNRQREQRQRTKFPKVIQVRISSSTADRSDRSINRMRKSTSIPVNVVATALRRSINTLFVNLNTIKIVALCRL